MSTLKRKSTKIDLQVKLFALEMFNEGNRVSVISKKIGYSEPTIKYWINHSDTIIAQEKSELNPVSFRDINFNEDMQTGELYNDDINESNMVPLSNTQTNDDLPKIVKYYGTRTCKTAYGRATKSSPLVSTRQKSLPLLKPHPENSLSIERIPNSYINSANSTKPIETHDLTISPKKMDFHSPKSDYSKAQRSLNMNDNDFRNFKKDVSNCQEAIEELMEYISTGKRLVNKASNFLYQLQDTMNNYEIRKKVKFECQ